jgi:hypothetical protein
MGYAQALHYTMQFLETEFILIPILYEDAPNSARNKERTAKYAKYAKKK